MVAERRRRQVLPAAPEVDVGNLVHAGDRAARRAGFGGVVFAADIFERVFHQRLGRVAALLRAVVHQAVLADIEVARAGAAAPVILFAVRDVVLEIVDLRVAGFFHARMAI
jgi:hypothetical protein